LGITKKGCIFEFFFFVRRKKQLFVKTVRQKYFQKFEENIWQFGKSFVILKSATERKLKIKVKQKVH
jgi:hypothetical protein